MNRYTAALALNYKDELSWGTRYKGFALTCIWRNGINKKSDETNDTMTFVALHADGAVFTTYTRILLRLPLRRSEGG